MKKNNIFLLSIVLILSLFISVSCIDDKFDEPPQIIIPEGNVLTISQLRDMYNANNGQSIKFFGDSSVYATVIMDDKSGNIYKNAYVQDATGGINLHVLSSGGIYQGDSIRIYLKNLILGDYSGVLQLDSVDIDNNIIKQKTQVEIQPKDVLISEINTGNYQSQLVKLNNVQFMESELGKTYADSANKVTKNRMLEDSLGNTIIVRTSGYANFANEPIPEGRGSLIAVVSEYNGDMQLYIRSTDEVLLTNERFENGGGGGNVTPVDEINESFNDAQDYEDIDIEGWSNIIEAGNRKWQGKSFSGNKYAQATGYNSGLDEMISWLITPPINITDEHVLNFNSAKAYWEHQTDDALTVWISNDYDGSDIASATWTQLNAVVAGQNDPDNDWISSGDISLANYQGVGYIAFKYRGSATESTSIRIDDIIVNTQGGGGGGNAVTTIDEDFESQTNYEDIDIEGWLNFAESGTRAWQGKEYSNNIYAQATAYNSGEDLNVSWLITPPIDFDVYNNEKIIFETAKAYWNHNGLEVLISTDFDGTNVSTATWEPLDAVIAGENDPDHEWISSGEVDLSSYTGTGYIAFKYTGSDTNGETTSYRIDNIHLSHE